MPTAKPPAGYVGTDEAERITGYSAQTVVLAAINGELKAARHIKNTPWFFRPEDLRAWRGIEDTSAEQAS